MNEDVFKIEIEKDEDNKIKSFLLINNRGESYDIADHILCKNFFIEFPNPPTTFCKVKITLFGDDISILQRGP